MMDITTRLRARLDARSERGLPMLMTSDDALALLDEIACLTEKVSVRDSLMVHLDLKVRGLLDEVDRLTSLCKANNTLARMNGDHRDQWRDRSVKTEEALWAARQFLKYAPMESGVCCCGLACLRRGRQIEREGKVE